MRLHERFNRSRFSQFINSTPGRVFRLVAGLGFAALGFANRNHALGLAALGWSVLPLTAGGFDVCYLSAALGGPLSGEKIRGLKT
jgi:hypothetical protein